MAISLTTLNGTDSIASSRITINDNFSTISSALNSVLTIIDIATGYFDNTGYGSNNNIKTENITVTGSSGVTVSSGGISVTSGNVTLGGFIEFGSGTGIKIKKTNKSLTTGTINILDVAGATGASNSGSVGYFVVPRLTTSVIQDIQGPEYGAMVYDLSTNKLKVCVGACGATGEWVAVH
jgi:hypothetical protein